MTGILNERYYFFIRYIGVRSRTVEDQQQESVLHVGGEGQVRETDERLEDWEAVKQDYKFNIGESVRWEYGSEKFRDCRIITVNDSNHSAEVSYTDEKGEEKTSRAGYLKLTKMQNL